MTYVLYYWPGIQGRGEYVRLALEEGGAAYVDTALVPERNGGGEKAIAQYVDGRGVAHPPFAPPFLRAGRLLIGQTSNILLYLGGRLQLAPHSEAGRLWTHQLQLTVADLVVEIHDTHHPIASGLYYSQQKAAAKKRSQDFLSHRLPKFFDYFERVLQRNRARGPWLVGARLTYADLSLAQVVDGMHYAFPHATARALRTRKRIGDLHAAVFARPRIAAYVASGRRLAFNNEGIFRHYAELDR